LSGRLVGLLANSQTLNVQRTSLFHSALAWICDDLVVPGVAGLDNRFLPFLLEKNCAE
jgi:hypothetical protein